MEAEVETVLIALSSNVSPTCDASAYSTFSLSGAVGSQNLGHCSLFALNLKVKVKFIRRIFGKDKLCCFIYSKSVKFRGIY